MSHLGRYDRYGWDYEQWNRPDARAHDWYRRHAEEAGGPVLELACGTGSLLPTLAGEDRAVTGLDLSETMLSIARRRLAALETTRRARIVLVRGDMASFDLGARFALVLIADNSFREVETLEAMRACLRCVHRHLEPGGRLLVTERRYDASRFEDGVRISPLSEPMSDPRTGETVRRSVQVEADEEAGRIRGVMSYHVLRADGRETIEDLPFEGPLLNPPDYVALFEAGGFEPSLFVGYEDREDDGRDPHLCFVCRPRDIERAALEIAGLGPIT